MAKKGINQPAIIHIDETLRLRKFDGIYDFALEWYQDEDMIYMVDGFKIAYDMDRLNQMDQYLNKAGELLPESI